MRIGIDLQPAFSERTGVGQYAYYLAKHLPLVSSSDVFIGLAFGRGDHAEEALSAPNMVVRRFGWIPRRGMSLLWRGIGWPPADLFTGPVDVFHFPSFVARPLRAARAVATIHDLAFKRIPECAEPKNAAYLDVHVPRTLERASLILVDSEFTARELTELYGYPHEKIRVTYLGVDERFRPCGEQECARARRRFGLPAQFILCVATFEPRKNIRTLLRAYALMREGWPDVPHLVLVGPEGWRGEGEKMEGLIDELGLREHVVRIRYVEHDELPGVYSAARLFAFPALYEGFGLPVLEAMACGTPVVCSDAASLPEVVGDAAVLVSPLDMEGLARAMGGTLRDSGRINEMVKRGLERAGRFTWRETARRTMEAYREVGSGTNN